MIFDSILAHANVVDVASLTSSSSKHFSKSNGVPPVDFKGHFRRALKAAGIEDFRFHDLRHTFESHLAMSGVDLLTIKELMRHKTMAMTLRYAHLSSQHTQQAVNQLRFQSTPTRRKGSRQSGLKSHK